MPFLVDVALVRRNCSALCWVAGAMSVTTGLGFALNMLYVRCRLRDLVSRLNSDVGEVQHVGASYEMVVCAGLNWISRPA